MPSRRRFLAVLGSVSLAGCVDGPATSDSAMPTSTDTATETLTATPIPRLSAIGETVTADGADLTLVDVATASALPFVYTDSGGVQYNDGGRYVLAEIASRASSPPEASRYSLSAGGRLVGPADPRGSYWFGPDGHRDSYSLGPDDSTESGGWLAFPVDGELDVESPKITVLDTGWRLPESVTERLRQPAPQFNLVSFDHPETVAPDEPFTVSVTAENVGPVTGSFRGVLNAANVRYAYYPHEFALALDPGERATWELEYAGDEGLNGADDSGRFDLRTVAGNREGTVEVGGAAGTET